ncbi:MAG: hypothetical protein QM490_06125 [Candidatus Gracilibacteria bacterium]
MDTTMVACNVYKLLKSGNKFTQNGKEITSEKIILSREYVDEKNANWETNGLWHEKLEDLTKEYIAISKERLIQKEESKKVEGQLRNTLLDVIEQGNINEENSELSTLKKQYQEKFNKRPFYKWGVDELKEKLKG